MILRIHQLTHRALSMGMGQTRDLLRTPSIGRDPLAPPYLSAATPCAPIPIVHAPHLLPVFQRRLRLLRLLLLIDFLDGRRRFALPFLLFFRELLRDRLPLFLYVTNPLLSVVLRYILPLYVNSESPSRLAFNIFVKNSFIPRFLVLRLFRFALRFFCDE